VAVTTQLVVSNQCAELLEEEAIATLTGVGRGVGEDLDLPGF